DAPRARYRGDGCQGNEQPADRLSTRVGGAHGRGPCRKSEEQARRPLASERCGLGRGERPTHRGPPLSPANIRYPREPKAGISHAAPRSICAWLWRRMKVIGSERFLAEGGAQR